MSNPPLDVLETEWVAAVLLPRGWRRDGRAFRFVADNGDQVIVAITASSSTARPEGAVVFYVDVAAVPTTQSEWLRYLNPSAAKKSVSHAEGLHRSRLRPDPGTDWQSYKGSRFPGDDWVAHLDVPDGIETCGAALAAKVAEWAPFGESLVDRANLRRVMSYDDWAAAGILLADQGPSPALDAVIAAARGHDADKFADWLTECSARQPV